jgi:hypothetical protein
MLLKEKKLIHIHHAKCCTRPWEDLISLGKVTRNTERETEGKEETGGNGQKN